MTRALQGKNAKRSYVIHVISCYVLYMCGRVITDLTPDMWHLLGVTDPGLPPRYNATRGATLGLIRAEHAQRSVIPARWGLVPESMTRQAADQLSLFNARIETAHQKAAFRDAWKERHALLPVSGWIEWRPGTPGTRKQPHLVRRLDGKPVVLAALWTEDQGQATFTVLTQPAGKGLEWLHARQPLALPSSVWNSWLSQQEADLKGVPERVYEVVPLDPVINNARLDHPGIVQPKGDPVRAA